MNAVHDSYSNNNECELILNEWFKAVVEFDIATHILMLVVDT